MKKVLLLACLGAAIIGGCAPKPKVEPAPTPKTAESGTGNKDYMGASGSTAAPSGGAAYGSPAMGQIPESTPTDQPPRSSSGSGRSTAGASRVSTPSGSAAPKPTSSGSRSTAAVHGAKYVVKKGDTLSGIAKKHYGKTSSTTLKKIVAANPGMNPDKIRVGQTIVLP